MSRKKMALFMSFKKPFIVQGCSVSMAGCNPLFFLFFFVVVVCDFMDINYFSVSEHARKELGNYLALGE